MSRLILLEQPIKYTETKNRIRPNIEFGGKPPILLVFSGSGRSCSQTQSGKTVQGSKYEELTQLAQHLSLNFSSRREILFYVRKNSNFYNSKKNNNAFDSQLYLQFNYLK